MIMKLGMEQYVLKLYKVYVKDDPELTMTYKRQCQFLQNLFCTNSSSRYQVSVYRTFGPLVFHIDLTLAVAMVTENGHQYRLK